MTPDQVLAIMLTLTPSPGVSSYSLVPVANDAPAPCADAYTPQCRKPWYDARHKSHVRVETRAEGLKRYATIAKAISAHAKGSDEVARVVITITRFESGWRRDIHSGIGKYAIGDKNDAGEGQSWCMGQHMLGPDKWVKVRRWVEFRDMAKKHGRGIRPKDLIGVGPRATGLCVEATAGRVRWAMKRCGGEKTSPNCPFAIYGGLNPSTGHKGIHARGKVLRKLWGMVPAPLASDARAALRHRDIKPGGATRAAIFSLSKP